jgi:hypothetical protein
LIHTLSLLDISLNYLKRELQGDFKELKKSVDDISLSIND